MNEFIAIENINLLFEILNDDSNIKIDPNELLNKSRAFRENIIKNGLNYDLLTMNKIFISNYLSEKSQQPTQINNLKQSNTPELITFEEIQNNRKSEFENELKLKKMEFEDSIILKVPEAPNFKDRENDIPIEKMEELISMTLAQRNFEIDEIHNKNYNQEQAEKWLMGQETSVKSEKGIKEIIKPSVFKPTKVSENKHVSWDENISFDIEDKNEVLPDFFSKLKYNSQPQNNNNNYDTNIDIKNDNEKEEISTILNYITELKGIIKTTNNKLDKLIELLEDKITS
jgi:hypothetical protein